MGKTAWGKGIWTRRRCRSVEDPPQSAAGAAQDGANGEGATGGGAVCVWGGARGITGACPSSSAR